MLTSHLQRLRLTFHKVECRELATGKWMSSGGVYGSIGGSVDEVSQETHGLNFSGRILTLNPTTEASVKAQV